MSGRPSFPAGTNIVTETYSTSQGEQVFSGLLFLFVGSIFAVLPILAMAGCLKSPEGVKMVPEQYLFMTIMSGFGLHFVFLGRRLLWLLAYEVQLEPDGTLLFLSPWARFRSSIQDLRSVELTKGPQIAGFDQRELRITHREGVIRLRRLEDTDGFIARLKSMNSLIAVGGSWS
jgi:hypothetical protein